MIPLNDLSRELKVLEPRLTEAFSSFVSAGWLVNGSKCREFDLQLARFMGLDFAVGVANGTDALRLAMLALGVEPGDLIAMTANAGGYAATAAASIGAIPVWFDVNLNGQADPDSFSLLIEEMRRQNRHLKAVVVTHLFGQLANAIAISKLARSFGIGIIEDCAQAIGSKTPDFSAGTVGDIATLSFYPTKNLGALGDGGAIATNSWQLARKVESLKQYGWRQKYHNELAFGINSRLDELQAGFLLEKLKNLDTWNEARIAIMEKYQETCSASVTNIIDTKNGYNGHLAAFRSAPGKRDLTRRYFESAGIATDIHYPIPDFDQPAFKGMQLVDLRNTSDFCESVFSLPLFPYMLPEEVNSVCNSLGALDV